MFRSDVTTGFKEPPDRARTRASQKNRARALRSLTVHLRKLAVELGKLVVIGLTCDVPLGHDTSLAHRPVPYRKPIAGTAKRLRPSWFIQHQQRRMNPLRQTPFLRAAEGQDSQVRGCIHCGRPWQTLALSR